MELRTVTAAISCSEVKEIFFYNKYTDIFNNIIIDKNSNNNSDDMIIIFIKKV
jgi:hypothetical protein